MSLDVRLKHRLGDFTLDIEFATAGRVTALFGPSGAGKSSIVAAIAGLWKPRDGRIAVDGRVLTETPRLFVPPERRRVAVVFQDSRLFPHLTVDGNLRFGWRRAGVKASEQDIGWIVSLLGLEALLARRPRELSGGEKARVALGRALLMAPDMLLLDEPLASLDVARRNEILPFLERLARESALPMLYVSHQIEEVARLADEIVVIEQGRVVTQGAVFDVLTDVDTRAGVPPLGAVFEAVVAAHQTDGLTRLAFSGGDLFVPALKRPVGTQLRVRLRAEDLMLALEEPRGISANNVLASTIATIRPVGDHVDVQLLCGQARLVSRITAASAERLALSEGLPVYAVVKSVTVARES
jgi:molybdate transport system ATP-binding protein